jgi:alpha-N-arabinofuranosidase
MRDAIIAALNINIFARHADRVRIANIAQMVNVLQAMILTDAEKLVLTPTYHVFRLYVPFQDATFVPVTFDAGSYVNGDIKLPRGDAIAAKDKNGKIWLAVTNVHPSEPTRFELTTRAKRAAGHVLSGPKVDSVNTFKAPTTVAPKPFVANSSGTKIVLNVPPHSVAVVALEGIE